MTSWKITPLILVHLIIAAAIATLFSSDFYGFWEPIDKEFARFVNSWISKTPLWQNFWAMANHRLTDFLIEDLGFLLLFFWIIASTPKTLRIRKIAECLFILLFGACVILLANELIFRRFLFIQRKSPTLILDSFVRLSDTITWLKIKTESIKSFPGDHATTTLLSIVSFFFLTKGKRKIFFIALCFAIFLSLPRLVVGAHWITDVLIGSGSIVAILYSWAFCTPFAIRSIEVIEKMIRRLTVFCVRERKQCQEKNPL